MSASVPASSPTYPLRRYRKLPIRLRARRIARSRLGIPRIVHRTLGWDIAAGCCAGIFMGMVMPFLIKIARGDLGASTMAIGLMSASPFIGNLLAPVWARQMEGRGKIPFCVNAWIGARSLLFLMPLMLTAWFFVMVISAMQFVTTIATPAYASLMRDIYPDRARGKLMGYVRVALQASMFAATLITGRLLDAHFSYQILFPVAAVFGIGAALSFSHVRPFDIAATLRSVQHESGKSGSFHRFAVDTLKILRHNNGYRWFALSVSFYGFGNLMAQPLYALYQVDVLHITGTQIANLTNLASLFSIVGAFFWGRFIDRYGAPKTVFWGIVLVSLIPIVYLTAARIETLFVAAALWGLAFAGIELSYMASILTYAEPGRAAQYQSLHSLLLGIRGVLAPLVAVPLMHTVGFQTAFWIAMGIMAIGALMQWMAAQVYAQSLRQIR